ncbi:glycoside hydrolase family 15 protein [Methanoculleus sp. Wushi-C6]|uniref:Glycoside hydrolase family 15 protein n=1 Tax=Methanoculleus caldifontis TaxID=2651577 RepID=A0ABU3X056_9EURY|nr:glycoside hydrolase family 15 protein [Methanoculleus sp. Wushi-C6]MDV2481425.1 glycoside hydrolase family 15 protein [Methanoculleus sp. Wushi-C6]
MQKNGYKPISDYAVIGNLRTAALVGTDGSIDWCCFPYLDRTSVFAALLDAGRGGRFRVSVPGAGRGRQWYVEETNILKTEFSGDAGTLVVTDLMPLSGDIEGRAGSFAPPELYRILECSRGSVEVAVEWSPRFDYSRGTTGVSRIPGGWLATDGRDDMTLFGLEDAGEVERAEGGHTLRAEIPMREGERRVLIARWGTEDLTYAPDGAEAVEKQTREVWRAWAHRSGAAHAEEWAGDLLPLLVRSELVLKLLTNTATGAIAAAPTTSLPEDIGGVRNWDYRFSWIRDSAMTAQALIALGHEAEAIDLLAWMERVSEIHAEEEPGLRLMYSIHGWTNLEEEELPHFEGYRGSRPVRIGNEAATQLQLEIYGELLNTAYELVRRGYELPEKEMAFLTGVADEACSLWKERDHGIWEIRGEQRHYVYSKVMLWVALDRAVHLAEQYGLEGDKKRWARGASAIKQEILEEGYDAEVGAFVQSYGSKDLDAANLRIGLLEFLPFDDERVQSTIDRTMEELVENGLVYRYRMDDGLPGEEGAFGLCTFWLIDCLALSGRISEARPLFERMVNHANHAGLYPEQFDPETGEFLGNFPQAFTHIGLVNSALYLAYAEGKPIPGHSLIGTPEHRAELEGSRLRKTLV